MKLPVDEGLEVEAALRAERDRLIDAGRQAAAEQGRRCWRARVGESRRRRWPDVTDDAVRRGGRSVGDETTGSGPPASPRPPSGRRVGRRGCRRGLMRWSVWPARWWPTAPTVLSAGPGPRCWSTCNVPLRGSGPGGRRRPWAATLPDSLRRLVTCDADAKIVGWVGGAPVDVGRSQRTVPDRVRRIVEHRDRRLPGAGLRWRHVARRAPHRPLGRRRADRHLEPGLPLPAATTGPTTSGELGITGDANTPDGLRFTNRHGLELTGASRARPPTASDVPDVAPYPGPTGERLDPTAVHFSRRRPPAA